MRMTVVNLFQCFLKCIKVSIKLNAFLSSPVVIVSELTHVSAECRIIVEQSLQLKGLF